MTKYYVYGKNAVLGELEPVRESRARKLGIVVEAIAPALERATDIITLAARGIFMRVYEPSVAGTETACKATAPFPTTPGADPVRGWL